MDKVIKYKFWILSGLVVILTIAGYFMANGAIKAGTETRIAEIDAISVPSGQVNDLHKNRAAELAAQQQRGNDLQIRRLDQIQRSWMVWPPEAEEGLEIDPATQQLVYRGTNLRRDSMRYQFADYYRTEMDQLYHFVNPVVPSGSLYPSKNKLFLEQSIIPTHQFAQIPTVDAIWDAQEDYWILRMLFTAINQTNEAAQDVNSATIRQIFRIDLFGGDGQPVVEGGAAPAGDGGDAAAMGGPPSGFGGSSETASSGGGIDFGSGNIEFDPAEEYGSPTQAAAGGGGDAAMGSADAAASFLGGGSSAATQLRYIAFDPANPGSHRRRAFYLSVLIDEKNIPDFVTNLANLDPPVAVGRLSFGNNPYDQDHLLAAAPTGRSGGVGSMAAGGMGRANRGRRPPLGGRTSPGAEFGAADPMSEMGGPGMRSPRRGPGVQQPLTPAQQAELAKYEAALTSNKDLVRLDLTGVVTLFTPKLEPLPPEETAPAASESPDGAAPMPAAPAAEPMAPPSADPSAPPAVAPPAGEAASPAAPPTSAESPATPPPAGETPATPAPPAEAPAAAPPPATEAASPPAPPSM